MSSEIITSNDLKKILASAFPARANTTITSITLPYTPPCNGLFLGMLRATAQGRAYKQYSNTEPSLWDFYQVAGGYSTFVSFVQAGKQIAETSTANISETPYYFFIPLDGTSPLFGGTADAVVEEGMSGTWTYRKWSSGKAELWGNYTAGSKTGAVWSSPIYYTDESVSFLSGFFNAVPTNVYATSHHSQWSVWSIYSITATGCTLRHIKPNNVSQNIDTYIYALGKWK